MVDLADGAVVRDRRPARALRRPTGANALWTWLFFHWRLGGWAFAEILVLWLLIAATTVAFWRLRPLASALLMPYLAWVAFAAALNWALLAANPDVLG